MNSCKYERTANSAANAVLITREMFAVTNLAIVDKLLQKHTLEVNLFIFGQAIFKFKLVY